VSLGAGAGAGARAGETLVQFNYNPMRAFVLMGDVASAITRLRQLSGMSPVERARLLAWIATGHDIEHVRDEPGFRSVLKSLAGD
jgi:hypothetical protein